MKSLSTAQEYYRAIALLTTLFVIPFFTSITSTAQPNVTNVAITTPTLISPVSPICAEKTTVLNTVSFFRDTRPTQQECKAACMAKCQQCHSNPANYPNGCGYYCSNGPIPSQCDNDCPSFTPVVYTYEWQYHISGETTYFPNPNYQACLTTCSNRCEECHNNSNGYPNGCGYYCSNGPIPSQCSNDCVEYLKPPEDTWRTLGSLASNNSYSFIPSRGAMALISNAVVEFRVRVVSSTGQVSQWSAKTSPITFFAPAPEITSISSPTPSCPGAFGPNGIISVTVNGTGNYKYIVRNGNFNTTVCDPSGAGLPCFEDNASGSGSGLTFNINGVNAGDHTVWITNRGGEQGVCYSTNNINVGEITSLSLNPITSSNKTDLSCNDSGDGKIVLGSQGGKPNYTYTLKDVVNNTESSNSDGVFENLKASNYTASVIDGCLQVTNQTFTSVSLYEPRKIKAVADSVAVTCNSPANGQINVAITEGPGTYNYILSTGGSQVSALANASVNQWITNSLPDGTYTIEVKDAERLSCPGYTKSMILNAPTTLTLNSSNITIDSVDCFGGLTGSIALNNLDMSGNYQYILSDNNGLYSSTNTTNALFSGLAMGDYTLTQKRNIQCDDNYVYPSSLNVLQPDRVTGTLTKTDISCYGKNDGKIAATTSGGNGTINTRIWEIKTGSNWSTIYPTSATVSNLIEGTYRLRLLDKKQCDGASEEVTIIEPTQLEISNIVIHDIQCYGDKAKIEVVSTGGVTPYTFEYSTNNGNTFTVFSNNNTLLEAGNYNIKTKDKNGCNVTHTALYHITSPPSPLTFTQTLSDFNGFNISCHGGSNGTATLLADGGNGAIYNGYMYAVDGVFQSEPLLSGINAGPHALAVKDARGCVVSKTLTFTQTTGKLTPQLITKKDVACFGDTNGSLDVNATGGLGPFKFSINGLGNQQDHGLFTGLEVGDYTVSIIDKNNCDNNFTYTIASVNPKIQIATTVSDVNCFNGSDGAIQAFIKGGALPLQYKWNNTLTTSSKVEGLKSGTHALEVIDNAGCKRDSSIVVLQPATALDMKLITIPVCYGRADGTITATGFGGTSPYRYSIDGGQHYQTNQLFTKVKLGKYNVKAEDKNGCTVVQEADVFQRNDRPEPNFLVATKRNALDTLIVTEISVPKPDSIIWDFGTSARLLNENQWAPEIKFEKAGTFAVNMTGFFGGCDYAVTKNIFVSPFDASGQPEKQPGFKPIERFEVSPNPSSGEFEVMIDLNKKYNVSVIVYDMLGSVHFTKQWEETTSVKQNVQLTNAAAGIYLVRAITESDAKDIRIVIK